MPAGSTRSSGPTAATIALSSEAKTTPSPRSHHVQRLDAERVAGEGEVTGLGVVDREGEHAAEAGQGRVPQARQASSTTSVSERVANEAPERSARRAAHGSCRARRCRRGSGLLRERLVRRGRQVDDREPGSARASRSTAGRTISCSAHASGPRWAIRSIIVLARILPSGCWKVPAIPHMDVSAPRPTAACDQVRRRPRGRPRCWCSQASSCDDPLATDPAHRGAPLRMIQQADDSAREQADVVGFDVHGGSRRPTPASRAGRRRRPAARRPCTPSSCSSSTRR